VLAFLAYEDRLPEPRSQRLLLLLAVLLVSSVARLARLVSNPRVCPHPMPISAAWAHVEEWLALDVTFTPEPTERHREVLAGLMSAVTRAELIPTRISRRSRWSTGSSRAPRTPTSTGSRDPCGGTRWSDRISRGRRRDPRCPGGNTAAARLPGTLREASRCRIRRARTALPSAPLFAHSQSPKSMCRNACGESFPRARVHVAALRQLTHRHGARELRVS